MKLSNLRNLNKNKKALSPIISAILLLVVGIILVLVILSWGKNFTNTSLNKTNSLVNYDVLSDKQPFIRFVEAKNGLYVFDYFPPNQSDISFTIVGYSLLGYNDYIPLEPEYTVDRPGKHYVPLGIVNEEKITISLLQENGHYLTFKNITNKNLSPTPSDCPAGFVPVPGNALYGTVGSKGGFCVMQYEAKIDENDDGIGDENISCKYSSSFASWNDSNTTAGCSYTQNNRKIVSSAEGYPLTNILQPTAIDACASLGAGYHLMTNDERMTILRNIEIVPDNWISGTVGQGSLKIGNAGSCTVSDACYDGPDPDYGTERNQLAMLKLTNGSEMWDLSGNVREWLDENISLVDEPDGANDVDDSNYTGWSWFDYKRGGGLASI